MPETNKRFFLFLLILILLVPLPAALTSDNAPQTHRTLLLSTLFLFLFTYGFSLLQKASRITTLYKAFFFLCVSIECLFFFHNYFSHENMWTGISRREGYEKTVHDIAANKNKYDHVFVFSTNWFPAYYLYFTNTFDQSLTGKIGINFYLKNKDNISFFETDCPSTQQLDMITKASPQHTLVVIRNACETLQHHSQFQKHATLLKTISTKNHQPIFSFYQMR